MYYYCTEINNFTVPLVWNGLNMDEENQSQNTFRDLRDMEVHNVQWTETTRRNPKLVVDGYR